MNVQVYLQACPFKWTLKIPSTLIPFVELAYNWQVDKWSPARGQSKVLQEPVSDETEHGVNTKGLVCMVYSMRENLPQIRMYVFSAVLQ